MIQWKMETQLLLQVELKGVLIVVVSVTVSVIASSWSIREASTLLTPGGIISGLVVIGEKSDVFVRSFQLTWHAYFNTMFVLLYQKTLCSVKWQGCNREAFVKNYAL
ncbi:hypothetical protein Peur_049488 [Populus x canadensis]